MSIFQGIDRVNRGLMPVSRKPTILIDLADACSLKCIMCQRGGRRTGNYFMQERDFYDLLSWLKEAEPRAGILLPFWTGESTIHPQFAEFLKSIVANNREHQIADGLGIDTNLQSMDDYNADFIMDCGQFKVITFSLDACTAGTYYRIRCRGDYGRAERMAIRMLKRKAQKNLKLPVLVFQFLVMPENFEEAGQFVQHWQRIIHDVGLRSRLAWHYATPEDFTDQVIFVRRCDAPRGQSRFQRELEELHLGTLKKIGVDIDRTGRIVDTDEYRPLSDGSDALRDGAKALRRPCSGPFTHLAIRHDLRVSLCCQDIESLCVVGRATESSYNELWCGTAARRLREAHLSGDLGNYPGCEDCFNQIHPIFSSVKHQATAEQLRGE